MKTQRPKKLFVRFVENQTKLSVGEYLNAKWRNVCDPFKINDKESVQQLKRDIEVFKIRTKREVEFVAYCGSDALTVLNNLLK